MTTGKRDQLILTPATLSSHFAEAYRTLRANISFSSIDRPVKTIVVTSASPREGKSTTTVNLGIIVGQAGTRVLVVDADFRHPTLHHAFGIATNGHGPLPGLSNVIVGSSSLDDVIQSTAFANVSLICAGVVPPNPSELLASQRMRTLMDDLAERADLVLFDSPPCLLYADAFVLSNVTDGVLYVLRAGVQDKPAQSRIQKQLQQAKARLLGVVFNDVEVEDSRDSYAYYYPGAHRQQ